MEKKSFWKRMKEVGPGAMVAAAFIGPGTVTSCATSGANYGTTLLWAMLLSVISVIIMQEMAARLGIASQMGLGQALRSRFTSKAVRILLAVLVISAVFIGNVAYETGNITGGVLGLRAVFPVLDNGALPVIMALVVGVAAFFLLFSGSTKAIEKVLTAMVVIMGVLFLICGIVVWVRAENPGQVGRDILKGLFGFKAPDGSSWMTIAALMGTTVVPYNIYLHASSAAKKWNNPEVDIKTSLLDSILSIGLGGLISMAIIICASFAGFETAPTNGGEMAKMLSPLLGNWATVFFGIGLFAAGATSTITAPLAAAFASSGILGLGEQVKSWKFRPFWMIVVLCGMIFTILFGKSPTEIILFAQAANAFLLPITGILLIIVCNSKNIMGKYKNNLFQNILGIVVVCLFLFIAARNGTAFVQSFRALIGG